MLLKRLLQGTADECAIQDANSTTRLTIRTRYKDTFEILGCVARNALPVNAAAEPIVYFKFLVKPAFVKDLAGLLSWCKNQG